MMLVESIQKLDETLNLSDYTSRQVAIITIIFLGILLVVLHERGGYDGTDTCDCIWILEFDMCLDIVLSY